MWRVVPDFPNYEISDEGIIRRVSDGHVVRQYQNNTGVVFVTMWADGVQCNRGVARLVAQIFIPHPNPYFDTPININGDRWDNSELNIAWRPLWHAIRYNRQFKQRGNLRIDSPIYDINTGEVGEDSFAVATSYGLLEEDVVLSIQNMTYVWPTYQQFRVID